MSPQNFGLVYPARTLIDTNLILHHQAKILITDEKIFQTFTVNLKTAIRRWTDMPGNRCYPPERIRYASYIWPADWQPERTSSTSTPTSTSFRQGHQEEQHCACCIRSYFYVTPSPEAFQRHHLVLSRCEQFDPWLLDRHGYSRLISDATSVVLWAIWTNSVYDSSLVYMSVDYFYYLIDWLLWRVYGSFLPGSSCPNSAMLSAIQFQKNT